jgi:hypothetical protein
MEEALSKELKAALEAEGAQMFGRIWPVVAACQAACKGYDSFTVRTAMALMMRLDLLKLNATQKSAVGGSSDPDDLKLSRLLETTLHAVGQYLDFMMAVERVNMQDEGQKH